MKINVVDFKKFLFNSNTFNFENVSKPTKLPVCKKTESVSDQPGHWSSLIRSSLYTQ